MYGKRRVSIGRDYAIGFGGKYKGEQGGSWQWLGQIAIAIDAPHMWDVFLWGKHIASVNTKTEVKIAIFEAAKHSKNHTFIEKYEFIDKKGRVYRTKEEK